MFFVSHTYSFKGSRFEISFQVQYKSFEIQRIEVPFMFLHYSNVIFLIFHIVMLKSSLGIAVVQK